MTDTLELDVGWRPGDLVRARYRLQAPLPGEFAFEAIDELTGCSVEVVFRDPSSDDVSIREPEPVFGQPSLPFSPPRPGLRERVLLTLARVRERAIDASQSPRVRIGAGVVVLVVAGFFLWPRAAPVPVLRGMSRSSAQKALSASGLREGAVVTAFDDHVPVGAVISTTPTGGTRAHRGSPVAIRISRGPRLVGVPDVVGRSLDDARASIAASGLRLRGTREVTSRARRGTVVAQDPRGRLVPAGSSVDLTLSRGSRR